MLLELRQGHSELVNRVQEYLQQAQKLVEQVLSSRRQVVG